MPSYYDSTREKPGIAKVKYNKGGKVKKMKKGGLAAGPTSFGLGKLGGGTIARGSGAARPQKFHKNG